MASRLVECDISQHSSFALGNDEALMNHNIQDWRTNQSSTVATESAFIAAMNTTLQQKEGVNGAHVYTETGVNDVRVSLFTMLVRGLEPEYIAKAVAEAPQDALRDLCVMTFHCRDIRGGKGERDLFYALLRELNKRIPEVATSLLKLVPEYGCWRDLWELYAISEFREAIEWIVLETWIQEGNRGKPYSLLAKWLPRETSKTYPGLACRFADILFPHIAPRYRLAAYRKAVSERNRSLKTNEIDMCAGTWSQIVPGHVPGRSLGLHSAAFFNLTLKGKGNEKRQKTQDQRSALPDRIQCKENFANHLHQIRLGKQVAKAANVVYPHEIVRSIQRSSDSEKETRDLLEAQWSAIRDHTASQGGLQRIVPMCDFSGSMNGLPIEISLALGILISEVNHPSFRDHILTFDSEPKWHSFVGKTTLSEKIQSIGELGQGFSTNFYKACQLIIQKMEEARVPVGEEPTDLVVLTDMGWDAARTPSSDYDRGYSNNRNPWNPWNPWNTQISLIRKEFEDASRRVWGTGTSWKVPRIIIWNLQAAYKDFHAKAEDEGVLMISGWSPNVLKVLQKGGTDCITPYAGMRLLLDEKRYDAVREAFDKAVTSIF